MWQLRVLPSLAWLSVGQPSSKSILKKISFISGFQTGLIFVVITYFSLSFRDAAWVVCLMIKVTTAVAFRDGQLSQNFGTITWSFPLTFTSCSVLLDLRFIGTIFILNLCDTLSPLFLLSGILFCSPRTVTWPWSLPHGRPRQWPRTLTTHCDAHVHLWRD